VEYASVDEAKAVINDPADIVLDGCTLYIEYGKAIQFRPSSVTNPAH